jgi:hypothetical protein
VATRAHAVRGVDRPLLLRLRPGSAGPDVADVRERTIKVDKAISLGEEGRTKTGARSGQPNCPPPLATISRRGRKSGGSMVGLVFRATMASHGRIGPWRNRHARVFQPAMVKVG